MNLNFNPDVVDRLIAAYNPLTPEALAAMATQLGEALHASQTTGHLYNLALDGALVPNVALAEQVHPWNLAATLLSAVAAGPSYGLHPAVPELWVWQGEWVPLRTFQIAPRGFPITAQQQAAPAPADALTSPAAVGGASPLAGAEVAPVEPDAAPAHAQAESGPVSASLPPINVCATVTSPKGRPQKSAFDREYRARDRLGAMPTWWVGAIGFMTSLFEVDPAQSVPVENSPSPVMEFGLAVDLAQRVLRSAPADATAAELRTWLDTLVTSVEGSPSGPVAFDLATHLHSQRAAAIEKQKKEATND